MLSLLEILNPDAVLCNCLFQLVDFLAVFRYARVQLVDGCRKVINARVQVGDVGVQILQGGSTEKPIPVFSFYNLSKEDERVLIGFSSKESIDSLIAALQHVRSVYYPAQKHEKKLGDTQQFRIDSLK